MKLSPRQVEALIKLRDHGRRSAYPGLHIGTLNALSLRGMVKAERGLGSMAMPHTSIMWSITEAGRLALRKEAPDAHR